MKVHSPKRLSIGSKRGRKKIKRTFLEVYHFKHLSPNIIKMSI